MTSRVMGDCAGFEHAFSHTVPQFWGAVISTSIVCVGLLIFNWQMGIALLWVAPVSFAIVIVSRKWQDKLGKKHMGARFELAEEIQECLETVQDIKACNQEEDYLKKLDAKDGRCSKSADFVRIGNCQPFNNRTIVPSSWSGDGDCSWKWTGHERSDKWFRYYI